MNQELRCYRLAEKVLRKTGGKGDYFEILDKAREVCKKTRPGLISHVGDDYSAGLIANEILGERKYY